MRYIQTQENNPQLFFTPSEAFEESSMSFKQQFDNQSDDSSRHRKRIASSSSLMQDFLYIKNYRVASQRDNSSHPLQNLIASNSVMTLGQEISNAPQNAIATAPQKQTEDSWDVLAKLIGTIEAPPDWASEHDHYLYGTPKHQ